MSLQLPMGANYFIHAAKPDFKDSGMTRSKKVIVLITLSFVFLLSFLDIAGWVLNLPLLESIGPHWESMKLITALCFMFYGLALLFMYLNLRSLEIRIFSTVLAALIASISMLSLYTYFYLFATGHESPVIQISFFRIFLAQNNRMAFLASGSFLLLAGILFLLPGAKSRTDGLSHIITIPVFLISYFTIVSYILGVPYATRFDNVAIPFNTGLAFGALCLVIAHMRPGTWLMRFYNLPTLGGIISRKLLLPAIIVPVIIGWCRLQGERFGIFESDQGVVFVAITYSICFLLMVWLTARYVNRIDLKRLESEETLRHSEERFRTITETVPVLLCITRIEDSIVMFTNEVNNKAFGLRGEDIVGTKGPNYYCNPSDRERMITILKEQGVVTNFEVKVKKRDGTPFWIMTSVRPIIFKGQSAMIGASIDITDSKKTEEALLISEERFRAIAENIPDLIVRFDKNLRLQYANPAVIKHMGLHLESLLGKTSTEYGSEPAASEIWDKTAREVLSTGESRRIELINNWQGVIKVFDALIVPEIDLFGKVSSVISIARDITDRKHSENALRYSEQKLKELVATKDKFFNIVAHDLKNPFTSLLGSSELLYNNIDQMSADNIRKLALILNDSAKGGYSILQNLLDWSRSETGLLKFNPESLNLRIVINENLENVQLQVANKGISAISELSEDFFVFTDKNMINTVLRNLISNAVKYTYKKGTVVVRATKNTKECIITVKDSGIGIEKEKVGSLFRLENSLSLPGTEKEQGTGLGLKLCKEFTERMGGRIWVESWEGEGSEFNFTIPVKE